MRRVACTASQGIHLLLPPAQMSISMTVIGLLVKPAVVHSHLRRAPHAVLVEIQFSGSVYWSYW